MSGSFEDRHRQRKRSREMEIIMDKVAPFVKPAGNIKVFEFGSGDGYQIPYLRRLGSVIASDIYQSDYIKSRYPGINFVICDVRTAPFALGSFNLIFANHVLEHIENISKAFSELKRIGKNDCVYVFTVPTSIWLLLSIPAQLYNGLRKVFKRISDMELRKKIETTDIEPKTWRRFLPRGHGWRKNFFDCFNSFKIENWEKLFREGNFDVVKKFPLLLYAPSEFPIIPTTEFLVRRGIYSSVVFIMRKT